MLQTTTPHSATDHPLTVDCPLCSFKTSNSFGIRCHAIRTHLNHAPSSHKLTSPNVASCNRFICQVYVCSVCGLSTSNGMGIKNHVEISHPTESSKNHIIVSENVELGQCIHNTTPTSSDSECDLSDLTSRAIETDVKQSSVGKPSEPNPMMLHTSPSANETLIAFPSSSGGSTLSPLRPLTLGSTITGTTTSSSSKCEGQPKSVQPRPSTRGTVRDWYRLIARSEKKFICLLCRRYIYSGRTEVVFHSVTRHLLNTEIDHDLSHYGRLTDKLKRTIGQNFADGMRIRSGVHYKDAKRVEAALFRSIELHVRYRPFSLDTSDYHPLSASSSPSSSSATIYYSCSGCGATFTTLAAAYVHVNEELRAYLPEFMRARSCPWSLSTRDEWVWVVRDLPIQPLPKKSIAPKPSDDTIPMEQQQSDEAESLTIKQTSSLGEDLQSSNLATDLIQTFDPASNNSSTVN